ncbi:replication/maintenance protein RepL [Enterobacter hormaechei]
MGQTKSNNAVRIDSIDEFEVLDLFNDERIKDSLNEIVEDEKDNNDIRLSVTTIVNKEKRISLRGEFVIAFTDNILELNLTNNEFKILVYILKIMEFGNLIGLSQKKVGEDLGLNKSTVSKVYGTLKEKKVLIDHNGHLYINSNIFAKGLGPKLKSEKRENLHKAQYDDENIKRMF